jgi:UDP-2,4-diacetamido-2,4,6-trideoxy-beta-L-altropyranose hydrolase
MPAARQAIFRTDASVTIGGGHVRRCVTLADALAAAGWDIRFVCSVGAGDIVPELRRRSYPITEPAAFEQQARARCALLVVDDYRLDAAYEATCRGWTQRILVIDDLANRRHDCDILADQSPARRAADYAGLVPADCALLLGARYALLDARFQAVRGQQRSIGKVARVFVNFGTTDAANATGLALDALAEAKVDAAVDIVIGGAAPHLAVLHAKVAALGPKASLHVDVSDMASLMQAADLAIGAGGVGALERCALGLPSLMLTVADNQMPNATAIATVGAARYLGDIGQCTPPSMAAALCDLATDDAARAAMSAAAMQMVDGRGAQRVREKIEA